MPNDNSALEGHPLYKVSLLVLEDWAHTIVDPYEGELSLLKHNDSYWFVGSVLFEGCIRGSVSVVCTRQFMRIIAANLLGKDSEDPTISLEDENDSLSEMANVLAGNFLTEAFGDDEAFKVVLPKVEPLDEQHLIEFEKLPVCLHFSADDEPVMICFKVVQDFHHAN